MRDGAQGARGSSVARRVLALGLLLLLSGCTGPLAARPASSPGGSIQSAFRGPRPAPAAGRPVQGGLRAIDGKLVDATGQEVRLTGVNWFGMETETFAPQGLWVRNWQDMIDQIAAAGFNTIRFPFSNDFLDNAINTPNGIDYVKNPDLKGLRGLALMDRIVQGAGQRGLKIILDRHRPTAQGQSELWYTDRVPEARWIADWVMLARHYQGNPMVLGADLHNEPHGPATWGDGNPHTDWRLAAERAGNAILADNPDWLIIVEGIENYQGDYYWWGVNLTGAGQYPVRLSHPDQLVYSTHDYGPGVYPQSWFQSPGFPRNLEPLWDRHWGYLKSRGIGAVLVGEFGGRSVGKDVEGTWQRTLVSFLSRTGISYTYWSWNPNSSDTGGILEDDWKTIDQAKRAILSAYQWPVGRAPGSSDSRGIVGAYQFP